MDLRRVLGLLTNISYYSYRRLGWVYYHYNLSTYCIIICATESRDALRAVFLDFDNYAFILLPSSCDA